MPNTAHLYQSIQRYPFTYGLAGFFCLCYLIQTLLPEMLLVYGLDLSTFSISTSYRLFTYILVHQNIVHLGMNVVALLAFGRVIEEQIGPRMYAGMTVLGTIIPSGTLMLLLSAMSFEPGLIVGASGITFTLIGTTGVLAPVTHFSSPATTGLTVYLTDRSVLRIVDITGVWVIAAVVPQIIRLIQGVSVPVLGHLSGFVLGIVLGLFLMTEYPEQSVRTLVANHEDWFRGAAV